jgi:hypothetical protein
VADAAILKQIIDQAGLKYDQTSVSYVFNCPRCGGKKKLYVRKKDGRFVCWVCKEVDNYQGRPEYALADLLGRPIKVIQSRLYGGADIPVAVYLDVKLSDFYGDDEEVDADAHELTAVDYPFDYIPIDDPMAKRGADYLAGRGVPLWMASQYGIYFCPQKRRVVFPVQSQGKLYGWQERLIVNHQWLDENGEEREVPKILSSTGIPREKTLMFADRLHGYDHAVLCEGPVDGIKAHLCGGNVVAMGKAVSPEQTRLLLNGGVRKLYLALDPDAADEIRRLVQGLNADVELYEMLAKGVGAKPDLGSMTFEEVHQLFLEAPKIEPGRVFIFLKSI